MTGRVLVFALALSAVSTMAFAGEKAGKATTSQNSNVTSGSGAGGGSASSAGWSSFSDLDKDSSGYIEQSESSNVPRLDFSSADADGDKRISRTEYETAKRGKAAVESDNRKSPDAPRTGVGGTASPSSGASKGGN